MKKISFFMNMVYAFIFQLVNMAFPILVSPYITRILGVDNYGKVNFSLNIANIFVIFAIFGTNIYGVKEVSKIKSNEEKLSKFVSNILKLKSFVAIIIFILYCLISLCMFKQSYILFLVQGLMILVNIFSLDWIFQGLENYKYISTRTCIIKILTLILIFTLIKQPNDYVLYSFILVLSSFLSYFISYIHIKKYIKISKTVLSESFKLIKPLFVFLLITLAANVYTLLDTVILGLIKNDYDVGIYSLAKTTILAILSITMTISTVIMPRSNALFIKDKNEYKKLLGYSYNMLQFFAVPLMFGMIALANEIIGILGGEAYLDAVSIFVIMSPLIIIVSLWTWNYQQRIIPLNQENKILKIQFIMLIFMTLLNVIMIPFFGNKGVSIIYVITELIGLILTTKLLNKYQSFKYINSSFYKYILSSLVMMLIIIILKKIFVLNFLILVITGFIIYFSCLMILKEEFAVSSLIQFKQKLSLFLKSVFSRGENNEK